MAHSPVLFVSTGLSFKNFFFFEIDCQHLKKNWVSYDIFFPFEKLADLASILF